MRLILKVSVVSVVSGLLMYLGPPSIAFAEGSLRLKDAWRMALGSHERIAIAGEDINQSERDIDRAFSMVLPSVTLSGNYTRYSEEKSGTGFLLQPEDSSRVEFRITQPLYSGGREWSMYRQAKLIRTATEVSRDDVREEIIVNASRAYYNLLRGIQNREITEASLKRAKEQLRVSSAHFKVGTATKADVLRAEAEAAEKEADLIVAEAMLRDAGEIFRRVTGAEAPLDISGVDAIYEDISKAGSGLTVDADVDALVEKAFEKRKDYHVKVIGEVIASEQIKFAKGNFLPSLKLEGVHQMREQTPKTSFFLDEVTYGVVSVDFPLFEGGLRRAELKQARSRLREAELERLGAKRDIELDVRRTYNNMEAAGLVIDSFKKQLAFAEENYSMVFKQYEYGLADNTDLIDADTTLVSAQLSLMRSTLAYELLVLELKRVVGTLLEEVEGELGVASAE